MSDGFAMFLLVLFALLIGFIAGLPKVVYMGEKDLAYVSSKCSNNNGIDYFNMFTYKTVCKDGAVFELNKPGKE